MLLALDLGTKMGYCRQVNGDLDYGTVNLAAKKNQCPDQRQLNFVAFLDARHLETPFTHVVYEDVRRHLGTHAAQLYGYFKKRLGEWCLENKLPAPEGLHVGTIKKYISGKGNAKKHEVIKAVKKLHPGFEGDENAADAIAIWYAQGSFEDGCEHG